MDENTLKALSSKKNSIIVNKLTNSGINVTPSILSFITNLEDPIEKVNIIIKESSFIPSFNGHLTIDILKKISNIEIKSSLEKVLNKGIYSDLDINLRRDSKTELLNHTNNYIYEETSQNIEKINKLEKETATTNHPNKISTNSIKSKMENTIVVNNASKNLKKNIELKKMSGSSKSSFAYRPVAKEYDADYKVLRDPTDKLYTSGVYKDFYELTIDKYNKLHSLMKKRRDGLSASNIVNILRISQPVPEISAIGMVNNIRKTKNGHFLLNIEDLTGSVNVLINKSSENQDNIKLAKRIINDQLIFVQGTYKPGDHGKKGKGIIFAEVVNKIDIPRDIEPNLSPDPLSILFLSDTHIGSHEFEEKLWNRFNKFLNGNIGNKNYREIAGRVKYIVINGDLVDGIGVYPKQEKDLIITDIYKQFERANELLSGIPEYIKIFYSSGNHDPVRNAIPRPAVPKKYTEDLINIGVKCIGNPATIKTHNVNTLIYHGDSMLDMILSIPDLKNDKPVEIMKEFIKCRHLAPIYGKKTQIAPTPKDWLVMDNIPDIFHTGHLHINDLGKYQHVTLVNSGCFQSQTDFMKSFGIQPTPGIVPIIDLDTYSSHIFDATTKSL